jgi:hypothetical protein
VTSLRTALLALLLLPAAIAFAAIEVPDCVEAEKHSTFDGTGYRHSVEVRNACDEPVECTASSDSAPDPVTFTVAGGGGTIRKVLKIGAPYYAFELRLRCEKQ